MSKKVKNFILLNIGSIMAAFGFNAFFLPNHIVTGGIGGLAISFHELFSWDAALFMMVSNIPLLLLCYFYLGKPIFLKTIYGSLIYPIFIKLTQGAPTITENPLLAALFGGIIVGVGLGLVFWSDSSTGGTGIIIQLLGKYSPITLGQGVILVDGLITAIGFLAFDSDTVMYSIIGLVTISYIINAVQTGFTTLNTVIIVSQKHQEIKTYINTVADRGVTEIPVKGGYSGTEQTMLMTTISGYEFVKLQEAITSIDETAFLTVTPTSQASGRGFSLQKNHASLDDDILMPM
ncbi:YitT family protein [Streptococcus thoraltensis]|uniref:YitT family protein n=1 Tax=Streptococcus thoraltensis TaxID=55085 RepID=UPI00036F0D69|nr:YitT family protein [Streptococcus thoraltensis]MDY4760763.1 YitT family protein [Streptococcus thoraltensis]